MRIYYAARGLRGKPYHSDIINKDLFTFFQGKCLHRIPSEEKLLTAGAFPKFHMDMGEYTDYEYVCEKGTFYIPKSICMGETIEPGRVFDHYFVVLCGDEVELRHLYRDRPWNETVGRDTEVTDPDVIAKMERTLRLLLAENTLKMPEHVHISHQALFRFLTLLGVADARELADKIHTAALREGFDIDEAYTDGHLNLMRRALRDRKSLDWVDWKEAPGEVFGSLCFLLPPGADERLPSPGDEDASPPEMLHEYSSALHDLYGLTVLLWDTGGDEYAFMVVPCDKVPEAFELASELGITLQHVEEQLAE